MDRSGTATSATGTQGHRGDQVAARHDPRPPHLRSLHQRPRRDTRAEIADRAPMPDSKVFFAQSGSEAVDTALKLARAAQAQAGHPEKTLVVSRTNGYSRHRLRRHECPGVPEYREGWENSSRATSTSRATMSRRSLVCSPNGVEIAAVITEPVQGAGGIIPPPEGYLQAVRRSATSTALYISDEVICGFGGWVIGSAVRRSTSNPTSSRSRRR